MPYIWGIQKQTKHIIMNTQNNNNRTEKKVLITLAILMGIFIVGASIQIFTNL